MRVLLLAVLLVGLAAPVAAQTLANQIEGSYGDIYVVAGRVLDSRGLPVRGGLVQVEVEGRTQPTQGLANCKGDFVVWFELKDISPKDKLVVTALDEEKKPFGGAAGTLDPFYRRSDVLVKTTGPWLNACKGETDVWAVSASIKVRLLNRTEPFDVNGTQIYAKPYPGFITMRYYAPDAEPICPPHPQDEASCETFTADERGDVKYTFTLSEPFDAGGEVRLLLHHNQASLARYLADDVHTRKADEELSIPIDPATRLGVANYEITGQGAPPELYKTPFGGLLALALAVGLALALARRR